MGVKVTGFNELLGDIEKHFGKEAVGKVSDRALLRGAEVFVQELQTQIKTFSDKKGYSQGHTYDEITIADPTWLGGKRVVTIHWRGPYDRYRIIHLNEWGTVKNPNPPGKGKIAKAMRSSEQAYIRTVREELRRGL